MRFNYTYSQFNYHLIGVNVANFDKIRRTISEISVIRKSYKKQISNMGKSDSQ